MRTRSASRTEECGQYDNELTRFTRQPRQDENPLWSVARRREKECVERCEEQDRKGSVDFLAVCLLRLKFRLGSKERLRVTFTHKTGSQDEL